MGGIKTKTISSYCPFEDAKKIIFSYFFFFSLNNLIFSKIFGFGFELNFCCQKFFDLHATLVNDADPVPDTDLTFHFDPTPSYSQVRNILFNFYSQHCQFT